MSPNLLNCPISNILFFLRFILKYIADETDSAIASTSWDSQEKKNEKADNENLTNEEDEKKEGSEINEENDSRTRKRTQKQRARLLPQKDVYKAAQQLDFTYV